jgi:arylformamidase
MVHTWIDITMALAKGMVHWPGDIEVDISRQVSMDEGADANVTILQMSAHTGTHVDAPLHFINKGRDVCGLPLESMIGMVKIFEINNKKQITPEEIREYNIVKGDRIFFKTANSDRDWSMLPFNENYIYLSTSCAEYLKERGVIVIGVDYLSVAGEKNGLEVHRLLLENEILIIEGLDLRNIEPGQYEMICLPLKITNGDGAPARVIIRRKD